MGKKWSGLCQSPRLSSGLLSAVMSLFMTGCRYKSLDPHGLEFIKDKDLTLGPFEKIILSLQLMNFCAIWKGKFTAIPVYP